MWIGDAVRMRYAKMYISKFNGEGKGKALDVGCGEGFYKSIIEEANYEYVGFDPVPRAPFPTIKGFVEDLPFSDNEFNLVIAFDILEELIEEGPPLREIYRVLKPGGVLLLHTPNKNQTHILVQPLDNPAHKKIGYAENELMKLLCAFRDMKIMPSFGPLQCVAWELAYCRVNNIPVDVNKLVDFDEEKYKNLGWLVVCKK